MNKKQLEIVSKLNDIIERLNVEQLWLEIALTFNQNEKNTKNKILINQILKIHNNNIEFVDDCWSDMRNLL
ncbi:hypothetical protein IJ579_08210 [bacterium]|nr:hypothetical protein [bacterium]